MRVAVEQGGRIKKVGQPVRATVIEPLYVGETLVIPKGAEAEGHVASNVGSGKSAHVSRLLSGDFTPPWVADISLDTLMLQDGTRES